MWTNEYWYIQPYGGSWMKEDVDRDFIYGTYFTEGCKKRGLRIYTFEDQKKKHRVTMALLTHDQCFKFAEHVLKTVQSGRMKRIVLQL